MCTWSGCRWPSSIRLSFCAPNLWNTSPRCRRICPNIVFLLHLGMNTMWYLHSHLVCRTTRRSGLVVARKSATLFGQGPRQHTPDIETAQSSPL
jgi:hypothetical protein